jgi:hypothetical protein
MVNSFCEKGLGGLPGWRELSSISASRSITLYFTTAALTWISGGRLLG